MAAEKLRAFLSHLPAYRQKLRNAGLGGKMHPPRVKDLYDLVRIYRKIPVRRGDFWTVAAEEFALACKSRAIDCQGIASFRENWEVTRETYEKDATIPKDVPFAEVADVLQKVVEFVESTGILPLRFEI
jgi:hypothetical protein